MEARPPCSFHSQAAQMGTPGVWLMPREAGTGGLRCWGLSSRLLGPVRPDGTGLECVCSLGFLCKRRRSYGAW